MKLVFFGTPEYVVCIVKELQRFTVVGVVTQKPRPSGRKQFIAYSPVDNWAHKHKVPVFYSSRDLIKGGVKADLGILAAYGEIIPPEVIKLFPKGILNIHPSLLPKYRGASPVQASIAQGDKTTGATIIKLDEKMDHGPIIAQFEEEITPDDTTETLRNRLFERGAEVLAQLLKPYLEGKINPRIQEESRATSTKLLKKDDGFIPLSNLKDALRGKESEKINNFIRSMYPWPGAWTLLRLSATEGQGHRLKILKAHLAISHKPSAIKLALDEVQLEGKTPVSWEEFKRGYPRLF